MGYNLQESLENTINTMGTLLGVHPIVPWKVGEFGDDNTINTYWMEVFQYIKMFFRS